MKATFILSFLVTLSLTSAFAAPTPGFYRLELALGSGAFQLTTADANGRVVWDRDNISAWAKFARDRPAPGLWKLSLARPSDGCFEDSGYSLAGVPGFLFLSPDKTWSFR